MRIRPRLDYPLRKADCGAHGGSVLAGSVYPLCELLFPLKGLARLIYVLYFACLYGSALLKHADRDQRLLINIPFLWQFPAQRRTDGLAIPNNPDVIPVANPLLIGQIGRAHV